MTLKFNTLREVVKIHVRAKFHQAKCSGASVIVLTERQKNSDDAENNTALFSAGSRAVTRKVALYISILHLT